MLKVIPLGGLGEIGLNSMVIEHGDEALLIDAGLMFPTATMPGVDVIFPDFSYLYANAQKLKGVLLTHGHEDHVGALPFLLRQLRLPVYGTRYTLGFLRSRLEEHGITADLREIEPRHPFPVGTRLTAEALRVAHSVPDAVGYLVKTPEGALIHTGDFKLDAEPIDDRPTDLERMGEAGEEGVLLLLSDSTGSEIPTETGSESEVARTFARIFPQADGRIIVALFASNILRVKHVLALAERLGRKVALYGRSMIRNVGIAQDLGYLSTPSDLLIPVEDTNRLPDSKVLIITTGAQGEPRSGLNQMATNPDAPVRIKAGDLAVLSSRAIPGNERSVGAMIDQLYWAGAKVAYAQIEPGIHVSGHASRPQQKRVLETVRPQNFIPIHGELRHLHLHLGIARELGMAPENLLLSKDGDVVAFEQGRGRFVGSVPYGRLMQDRSSGTTVSNEALREREKLIEGGMVVATVVLSRTDNSLLTGPQLVARGVGPEEESLLPRIAETARALFLELSPPVRGDDALVKEELVRSVRRAFKVTTGRRPAVMPVLVRL